MISDWLTQFITWITTIISFLSNFNLVGSLSLLHFIIACSIITMMITTFVSRGHE